MTETYEIEKAEYIKKLTAQIETIDKILNTETLDLINGEMEGKLRDLKEAAERYKEKLEKNEFEIAIVGLEKAGKSTFANAMMGNDILPSEEKRCTYTSTKICSGNDTAIVKFFTPVEFNENFVSRLKEMEIENASSYSFEALNLSSYQKMFERLDDKLKKIYRATVNEDIENILGNKDTIKKCLSQSTPINFSGNELASNNFKKYIKNPAYALAVKEIKINSSQLTNMPNAVIYDVPGFDSPTQIHKDQTVEFMREADAIVLVASAFKPSFTGPVVDLFAKESDYDGVNFGEKMFVFANMADRAKDLSGNVDIIKNDLRRYNMMRESNFNRIVPGSALAFLEKTPNYDGEKYTNNYAEDGIDKIKAILENYNQTERFEILKRRINQKQNEIYDVFKELFKDNDVSLSASYLQSYGKLLNDVTEKRTDIVGALEAYREELRTEYNSKREISQEVKDKVVSGITSKDFEITTGDNSEMQWAQNKASKQVTPIALTTKIDEILREKKREEIYQKFSEGILDIADEHHQRFDSRISKIFAENLGISQTSKAGEILTAFLKEQKHSFDGQGYYQSLIDRFSIDLFNILIDIPFADMKRYGRFESDFENFSSLAMFDDRKSRTNSGNSQPLYYSILFHQTDYYEKNGVVNGILDSIKTALDFIPAPAVIKLVESIVFSGKSVDKISTIVKTIGNVLNRPNQSDEQKAKLKEQSETNLVNELKKLAGSNAVFENTITKENYEKFFMGRLDKTTDDVKNEIEQDIDILHDALNDVVIKAINIEKAFLALEFRNIDRLLTCLNGRIWSDFVNNNLPVINAKEFSSLEDEQQRQESRKSILKDIKRLLDQMNSNSQTQNQ